MRVDELIVELLKAADGITSIDVKVDAAVPLDFEDVFEVKASKSWILLKPITKKEN